MITGFNTDIEYQGVTYHVQTEDKGLDTPLILSLVYNRGTILASKRAAYDDLLADKFDEKVLAQRLQKQHKLICAAVSAGRIEELKRMTEKESAKQKNLKKDSLPVEAVSKQTTAETPVFAASGSKIVHQPPPNFAVKNEALPAEVQIPKPNFDEIEKLAQSLPLPPSNGKAVITQTNSSKTQTLKMPVLEVSGNGAAKTETAIPKPKQEEIWDFPIKSVEPETIIDGIEIIDEDELILPAEAVEIVGDVVKIEPPINSKLQVDFLTDTAFRGGERKTVSISVSRGNQEKGIGGAQIMVKVLGSSFRPLIFHAKTDSNGIAVVHLQLPHFRAGRAAILVRAIANGEEAELRRIVSHG